MFTNLQVSLIDTKIDCHCEAYDIFDDIYVCACTSQLPGIFLKSTLVADLHSPRHSAIGLMRYTKTQT